MLHWTVIKSIGNSRRSTWVQYVLEAGDTFNATGNHQDAVTDKRNEQNNTHIKAINLHLKSLQYFKLVKEYLQQLLDRVKVSSLKWEL